MISGGRATWVVLLIALASLPSSGCSGDDDETGNMGGSAGTSQAGTDSRAGTSSSGASSGGSNSAGSSSQSGSGNVAGGGASSTGGTAAGAGGGSSGGGGSGGSAGGAVSGEHCSGGDVLKFPDEVYEDFGGPMSNCDNYVPTADGIQTGVELSVRNIELETPLTANQPYAFSIKVTSAPTDTPNTIELWSADDKCGAAKEKLYEGPMKVGILCVDLAPKASHPRLLMAWKGSGTRGTTDIAICPAGSCGP